MRFLLDPVDKRGAKPLSPEDILDIAGLAHTFVAHPYWRRMSLMLANCEKAEMETLLDPTSTPEAQMLSRAAVAYIRKVLAMPHVDIAQSEPAMKAIEGHAARFGAIAHNSAKEQ